MGRENDLRVGKVGSTESEQFVKQARMNRILGLFQEHDGPLIKHERTQKREDSSRSARELGSRQLQTGAAEALSWCEKNYELVIEDGLLASASRKCEDINRRQEIKMIGADKVRKLLQERLVSLPHVQKPKREGGTQNANRFILLSPRVELRLRNHLKWGARSDAIDRSSNE